jgi:chorismate-pyruvate lyase
MSERRAAEAKRPKRAIRAAVCLQLFLSTHCRDVGAAQAHGPVLSPSTPSLTQRWPADAQGRLSALAQLQSLNADLLSHDSATATLERWCAAHRLAVPARIEAEQLAGPEPAPTPAQRRDLAIGDAEVVRYRHVRLTCGGHVLSEAENWYVPGRLTPEMNRQLETTNTPFGRVVKPLNFVRHTLEARLLWSPLPENWELAGIPGGEGAMNVPGQVLQHRALLLLPDGTPFSEVVETYTSEVLVVPRGRTGVH